MKARVARALLFAVALATGLPAHARPPETDRIVVRLKEDGASAKAGKTREWLDAQRVDLAGETLTPVRLTGDGRLVMRLARRMPAAEIAALSDRLSRHPDVREVLPDRVFVPSLVPNDPQYGAQWALQEAHGVGAPAAWDVTTGSTGTVVAILDTGKLEHPDLAGRWVGGHDFVGDTARSNDGTGRDSDATDPGDWVAANECGTGNLPADSRWHGLAMAGIIAATGNNAQGVAGLDWGARLLPVRVVGKCGGYESDIADGMRWSVGIAVPGVPANLHPAKVLNVSLEATGACSPLTQGAIDEAVSAGATVIASAGNNGTSVANYSPANCERVIAVGATNRLGRLPAYSNTGAQVTLSAPGGEGEGADAILTTFDSGTTSANLSGTYAAVNGTSASAAHVSGLVSLMLSRNPTLLPEQVRFTLQANAKPFPSDVLAGQANCNVSLCGAGIADGAAVRYAKAFGKGDTAPMVLAPSAINQAGYGAGLRSDGRVFSWGLRASERTDIADVRRIAASAGSFLALKTDGTVWDLSGTAARVPGLDSILAIATGARYAPNAFSAALRANGAVFTWGYNGYGQLGDGTITPRVAPASVPGLAGVTAIATGLGHVLAVVDGEVWAWGWNEKGQLGIGNTSPATCNAPDIGPTPCAQSPVKVPGLSNVVDVHAGFEQSFAVKGDGTLWAWGANDSGQLGDGTTAPRTTPVQVTGITGVATISSGGGHTFAIKADGSLWAWGANGAGQLLTGAAGANVLVPTAVANLGPVSAVGAGFGYSFVVLADGRTLAAGASQGQLGIAADGCPGCFVASPSGVVIGNNFTQLFLDLFPPAFIPARGIATFGVPYESNSILTARIVPGSAITVVNGEYSIDGGPWTSAPGTIGNGQGVRARVVTPGCGTTITATVTIAGAPHVFSVTTIDCDTTPDPLGSFDNQVGVAPGSTVTSNAITVTGITNAVPIGVAGGEYSIGCNGTFTSAAGLVGPGQSVCVRLPAPATEDTLAEATLTVASLATTFRVVTDQVGFDTAPMVFSGSSVNQTGGGYALRSDGRLFGFGVRAFALEGIPRMRRIAAGPGLLLGLRADGTVWQGTAPVAGLANITAIEAAGRYPGLTFGLALTGTGSLFAFGNNTYGQLGDGTTTSRTTPAAVPGLANVTAIAAGMGHGLAVIAGEVWAWGWNSSGQLGDGTTTDRSTPAKIAGLANVVAVHAGFEQSFAVRSDGTLWAWGANDYGQLGDGTTTPRATPVQVTGLTDVATIATGGGHTFAIKGDGSLWAWGANGAGQLLTGAAGANVLVPTAVANLGPVSAVGAGFGYSFVVLADGRTLAAGASASQLGIAADGCPGCFVASPSGVVLGNNFTPLILDLFPPVFIPATDVGFGAPQQSGEIIAAGIAANSPVTVTGGEYSIDGGPWTSAPGTISNGQRLRLQVLSAGCGTTRTVTVTIAGVPRSFSASTVACDTDPQIGGDMGQPVNVAPGSVVTSGALVVNGINGPIPVSASPGAQYSVGCSTYTSTPGTVGPGQSVCLRLTAPATEDTVAEASVTIGPYTLPFRLFTSKPGFTTTPAVLAPSRLNQTGGGIGLRSDGRVYTWGLRAGLRTDISGVTKLAAADGLWLALRADGTVWNITGRAVPVPGLANITAIGAGARYSPASFGLALKADQTVWAWGYNAFGQLGDGSTADRAAPAPIAGLAGVTAIAAGMGHGLAVIGGEVWAWGWNDSGQLGIGAASPATCTSAEFADVPCAKVPVKVPGLANVVAVHAGWRQSFAIKSDGTLWAWGGNDSAQLGDGSTTARATPVQVSGIANVKSVAAGGNHTFAIKGDGALWAWGANGLGQLLTGTAGATRLVPAPVANLGPVRDVAAGWEYSFVIVADGNTFAAGASASQLGIAADGCPGCFVASLSNVVEAGNAPLVLVVGGLRPDPFAFNPVFGAPLATTIVSNAITVSGLGSASPVTVEGGEYSVNGGAFTNAPGFVSNGDTVRVRIASSAAYEAVTSSRLTIGGAVGFANTFFVYTRRDPSLPATVPGVSLGESHSAYLNASGLVFAFGYNGNGQLGNGTTTGSSRPMPVPGVAGIASFSSGSNHLLAARSDGTVLAWGFNASGQLGDGTTGTRLTAFTVPGLAFVKQVAAGRNHSLALRADGSVIAWGLNNEGQAGDGTTAAQRLSPVAVAGITGGITAIAAGGRHSLALRSDGTVLAWGANDSGQLGDGTTTLKRSPTLVAGLTGVIAIAAGGAHSLALKADGTVWAWGANGFGQLGLGDNASRSSPVQVTALGGNVGLVAAGESHTLAVKSGGQLFAWGNNANSQLGDSANLNRNLPFALPAPANVVAIAGGGRHSAALDASRRLFVFGDNFFGQVGNRSGNYSPQSGSLNVLAGDTVISTGTGGTASGVATGSSSGSGVIDIDGGSAFDFGSRATGATATVAGTFRNASATGSIAGIDVAVTGASFAVRDDQCTGATLGPGESCTFGIAFSPAAALAYEGELVLGSNLVGSPERRSLYGLGVPASSPAIAFARSGLAFAPAPLGTTTSAAIPVTNTGTSTLALGAIASPSAEFTATHDCAAVAPGASCTLTVAFRPEVAAARTAVLSVPSNAPGAPHAITVTGTGVAATVASGFALTVSRDGTGTVASSPAGIDCGATCSASFSAGAVVTLSANPAPGSYFTGWSGDCTGTGECKVTMDAARAVTAGFTTQPAAIPRMGNISTRMQVLTGNNVLIGGFIIGGTQAKTVVVRARGPSLAAAGVPGVLANPVLQLFSGATQIAANDNWKEATNQAAVQSSGFAPSNDFESAILATLNPGAYTAIVTGAALTTGVAIIEVFEIDLPQVPLANISTRGAVLTGADVMIGGFIIQGNSPQTVVVRARGPSLAAQGVPGTLANPLLQLFSGATQIAVNDNWQQAANATEIQGRGFAPSNTLESAILITLNPGAYTAIVSGAGGATGVAIIEVFAQ